MAQTGPGEFLRQQLVERVRGVFNDPQQGEHPIAMSDDALFGADTPIRMVHADVVAMMVGGMRGLLLQMLHPHALQGVLDHSNFRSDMHGRLRRTARFIAVTTYGHRDEAAAAIDRVNRIHSAVHGQLPDGTPYSARDPRTLAWVHLAEATSFLSAYVTLVRPAMPHAERDEYFRQFAVVAQALGADPVPVTQREAEQLVTEFRAELRASPQAREIAALVLDQRPIGAPVAVQKALGAEAIALLPPHARSMLGLERPGLLALPLRAATRGIGGTLRWAFGQNGGRR